MYTYFEALNEHVHIPNLRTGRFIPINTKCSICQSCPFDVLIPVHPSDQFGFDDVILMCNQCLEEKKELITAIREKYFLNIQKNKVIVSNEMFCGFIIESTKLSLILPNIVIKRTSGKIEHDWHICSVVYSFENVDYKVVVRSVLGMEKTVLLKELLEWNSLTPQDFIDADMGNSVWKKERSEYLFMSSLVENIVDE